MEVHLACSEAENERGWGELRETGSEGTGIADNINIYFDTFSFQKSPKRQNILCHVLLLRPNMRICSIFNLAIFLLFKYF